MHRDIKSAFDKIIAPKRKVIEHETDMKMRIGRRETRDRITKRQRGKRFGGKNFYRAGGLLLQFFKGPFLRFYLLDNPLAKIEMLRPGLCQRYAACGPREQPNAKVFFQVRHMPRNQRARQAENLGGLGEAAKFNDFDKAMHGSKTVHGAID